MGMFDSFYVRDKCPRCKHMQEFEFQTKAFSKSLTSWRVGDSIGSGIGSRGEWLVNAELSNTAMCLSKVCRLQAKALGEREMWVRGELLIVDRVFTGIKNLRPIDDPYYDVI